jgi:hypothetical protein
MVRLLFVPILAACLFFFITATHSTIAAPELSMQLSMLCRSSVSLLKARSIATPFLAPLIVSSWQHSRAAIVVFKRSKVESIVKRDQRQHKIVASETGAGLHKVG